MDRSDWVAAAQPEAAAAALAEYADDLRDVGRAHRHEAAEGSVRTASYRGHDIVIRTSYEITVDGRPFEVEATVNNAGLVHYHGLPTRNFASAVDLVKDAIDNFPDDFPPATAEPARPHEHGTRAHHRGGG